MAAMIEFSKDPRFQPNVMGAPKEGPEANGVITAAAYQRSRFLGFDFGNKGIRFDPADVKTEFWLTSKHKALADVLPVVSRWGCSAEFREVVEAFEPGLHQFFPITIRRPNGSPIERLDGREVGPGQYFILNALAHIDALLAGECIGPRGERRQSVGEVQRYTDDLCVSREAIAGRHLWLQQRFAAAHLFVSDPLLAALRERKLTGFHVQKVREA